MKVTSTAYRPGLNPGGTFISAPEGDQRRTVRVIPVIESHALDMQPATIHAARITARVKGLSYEAIAYCGEEFLLTDPWVAGRQGPEHVTCEMCRAQMGAALGDVDNLTT